MKEACSLFCLSSPTTVSCLSPFRTLSSCSQTPLLLLYPIYIHTTYTSTHTYIFRSRFPTWEKASRHICLPESGWFLSPSWFLLPFIFWQISLFILLSGWIKSYCVCICVGMHAHRVCFCCMHTRVVCFLYAQVVCACVCTHLSYHIFSTRSFISGPLSSSHLLGFIRCTTINTDVCVASATVWRDLWFPWVSVHAQHSCVEGQL